MPKRPANPHLSLEAVGPGRGPVGLRQFVWMNKETMHKEILAGLFWAGGVGGAMRGLRAQAGLYRQQHGQQGGFRCQWADDCPVPGPSPLGPARCGLVHHGVERARLCGIVGVCPGAGGRKSRDRSDFCRGGCDARLLPIAAIQGEKPSNLSSVAALRLRRRSRPRIACITI